MAPIISFLGLCAAVHILLAFMVQAGEHDAHNPLERINVQAGRQELDYSIQMAVNTTQITQGTGEWIEVSWHGVPHPSRADWIDLLVPAGSDPTRTTPAKYKLAAMDVDNTHLSHGKGRLRFRVISYRVPVQFAFFRGGLLQPLLAARGPVITLANANQPLHRRLALTGDNTEMLVQWTTRDSSNPVVKWGSSPGRYTHTKAASSSSYTLSDMCGPPANSVGWIHPGTFHTALLEGLVPGQRYYYSVGDKEWGFSPEAGFTAAPPVGPSTYVKLLAVADLGQAEVDGSMEHTDMDMAPSLRTTGLMLSELQSGAGYQLLVHNGDISYARGYVTQWDNFHTMMEPLISTIPYMTVPGNHERDHPGSGDRFNVYDSGGECGVALERRFVMPQHGPDKPWYSFDFGPIHFLQYSTEHNFAPGSEQHGWVLSDLAAVDRRKTPWVVVGGHRNFYISSTNTRPRDGDQVVAADLREAFEDAFVKYKVDLTLHGHHHSYQRTCPVMKGKCVGEPAAEGSRTGSSSVVVDSPAPVHLVIGNAGAQLTPNVGNKPAEIWKSIKLWWGYLRIEASGSQLKCEAVNNLDGKAGDSLTLVKSERWADQHMQRMQHLQRQGVEEDSLLTGQMQYELQAHEEDATPAASRC